MPATRPVANSVFDRPLQRVVVQFSVLRITAPKGTFTRDLPIWKQVNGRLPNAAVAMRLADNGFQAAIGQDADRKPLRELIDKIEDPHIASDQVMPSDARLVELELGPCLPVQTIWYYDPRGALHGRTYEKAQAKLKMAYELRAVNLDEVCVQVAPELEEPPGELTWVMTPEGPRQEQPEHRHTFRELVFEACIPSKGFLLLGPTAEIHDQPLLARPFFTQTIEGAPADLPRLRESLYVINPLIQTLTASPGAVR